MHVHFVCNSAVRRKVKHLKLDSFTQHVIQLESKLMKARSHEILNLIFKNSLS